MNYFGKEISSDLIPVTQTMVTVESIIKGKNQM
jgi:hypothetical protein